MGTPKFVNMQRVSCLGRHIGTIVNSRKTFYNGAETWGYLVLKEDGISILYYEWELRPLLCEKTPSQQPISGSTPAGGTKPPPKKRKSKKDLTLVQ